MGAEPCVEGAEIEGVIFESELAAPAIKPPAAAAAVVVVEATAIAGDYLV